MKRKVAMAMVAAMAVGSLTVPVMAEDGAAGGKIGISMPTQSLERWNRDGSYLQKQFEDAGYEVELPYSDNGFGALSLRSVGQRDRPSGKRYPEPDFRRS